MRKEIKCAAVMMGLSLLVAVAGCYEPTKEDMKTFEERGWVATSEAESRAMTELKEWAGIPDDTKIENVSMYGGKTPKVVVYGELKEWKNDKGETGTSVDDRKIKILNDEGKVIKEDLLSWGEPSKDKDGNVTAYIASDSYAGEQNEIVLLNDKGNVASEKKLTHKEEKEGWKYVLKEHERGYLSEDGNYLGVLYVKYWTDKPVKQDEPATNLPNAIYKFKYMDKSGKILWEIDGDENNAISGNAITISKNGERVLSTGRDDKGGLENENSDYLVIYTKEGKLIKKHYFGSSIEIKLTKDGKSAILETDIYVNGEFNIRFVKINLEDGGVTDLNVKNWNELDDVL